MVIPTLREWDLNKEELWKELMGLLPLSHPWGKPQHPTPPLPQAQGLLSSSSPPNQCNLEHFSLIISSLTKILIFNFCNADIRRHVKILGSKIIMWKKCYVFHHEQNIAHFIIKYLLQVFVQWTHLPKTLDLLFLLQGRVLLLLLFLFCFVFLNDIFPESSCDNT